MLLSIAVSNSFPTPSSVHLKPYDSPAYHSIDCKGRELLPKMTISVTMPSTPKCSQEESRQMLTGYHSC